MYAIRSYYEIDLDAVEREVIETLPPVHPDHAER